MIREVETGTAVVDEFPAFENDGYTKRSGLTSGDFTSTVYKDGAVIVLPVTISEIGVLGEYKTSFVPATPGLYELEVLVDFNKQIWHSQYQAWDEPTHLLANQARDQADKIDMAPVNPSTVADDSLADQLFNKNAGKTFDAATDSLEAISDAVGGLTAASAGVATLLAQMQVDLSRVLGLLHRNAILDLQTYDGQNQLTSARLRVFDSPANVPATPGGSETVGLTQQYNITATYGGLNVVTKFTLKQIL